MIMRLALATILLVPPVCAAEPPVSASSQFDCGLFVNEGSQWRARRPEMVSVDSPKEIRGIKPPRFPEIPNLVQVLLDTKPFSNTTEIDEAEWCYGMSSWIRPGAEVIRFEKGDCLVQKMHRFVDLGPGSTRIWLHEKLVSTIHRVADRLAEFCVTTPP